MATTRNKRKKREGRPARPFKWVLPIVGGRIRAARLAKGLIGKDVSAQTGLTEQAVLKWERGEVGIPLDRLFEVADYTGMPIGEFVNDIVKGRNDDQTMQDIVRSTSEMIRLWQAIPVDQRSHLLAVIRSAAEG